MTLPAPGSGNPAELLPPGTANPALAANSVSWDTYVQFVSGAIPVAFNDLVEIQFRGGTGGKSPGPGVFG
jgi:hypothetical protein